MRILLYTTLILAFAIPAAGQDLGAQASAKTPLASPENVPTPGRRGGDTIASATVIPMVPFNDLGTTTGFVDDYDEVCPYSGATAPDVVYRYDAATENYVDIDLCGSGYDTKLYVYDGAMTLIACNDDFYTGAPCGTYVSRLEFVHFDAGQTYYIVVDGYGNGNGPYVLQVMEIYVDPVTCPDGGVDEGEPPLVADYVDQFNGGCNTPGQPFQSLLGNQDGEFTLCGVSGWYPSAGSSYRDTDWFVLTAGPSGTVEVAADADFETYIFELGPQDCATVGVLQQIAVGPLATGYMTISGYAPGAAVWLWAGPTTFSPPGGGVEEYVYVVWLSGLEAVVATETTSWSTIKALYE